MRRRKLQLPASTIRRWHWMVEILAHIDTTREPSQAQIQQYIQMWLTEESLYREAIDRGLDRSDEMNKKVEDVRRQLAINALLEKEV